MKEICEPQKIKRVYGTANLHTGTGLVERTIQSLKNLILANLEDVLNLRESVNRALYVLRFTIHSETRETPFEAHCGRAPRTKVSNLKKAISVDSKEHTVYTTRNTVGEITDHQSCPKRRPKIQTRDDFLPNQKADKYGNYKQVQLPPLILQNTAKRTPWIANLKRKFKLPYRERDTP